MPQALSRQPDRLDRMLNMCDPAPAGALASDGIEDALDAIGLSILSQPRRHARQQPRPWWASPRSVMVVALALASLAAGAAAATTLFVNTHTHTYPPKWAVEGAGPGELLRLNGTNFRRVAFALSADIPYPSGYASWRDSVVSMYAKEPIQLKGQAPFVPAGQVRGLFAEGAICAWVIDWRNATISGDRARAWHDATVLAGALRWKAVRAWDPHPSTSVPGDGGTTHPSEFGWALPFISATKRGDLTEVDRTLAELQYWGNSFGLLDPGFKVWVKKTGASLDSHTYMRYLASRTRR